ncbi:MAG: PriCT-2 domain-containing protein [Opitutales bacterium]|nr:PriCT-2 domain-containing protein [Opitutales bacterium]
MPDTPAVTDLATVFPKHSSLFANAWSQEPLSVIPLGEILEDIRSGAYAEHIEAVRKRIDRDNTEAYDKAKRALPAFSMSAACMTRSKEIKMEARLIDYTGILQADLDAKDNPQLEDLDAIRKALTEDPHVAFLFTSPSGRGLKAGVRIDGTRHRESFFAVENHFIKKHGLQIDRSTKDPLRLCFVSHDPDLYFNPDATPVPVEDAAPDGHQSTWHPPIETTEEDVAEMLSHIPPRPHYDDWIRIASAVWSVLPMEPGCRLLAEWSPEEKVGEYAEKHRHKLDEISIGTLVWYAQQHGFDAREAARRKQWAGRIRFAEPTARHHSAETFDRDPAEDVREVDLSREFLADCLDRSQRGDAELFAKLNRGKKLYDHLAQCWRTYSDGHWSRDETEQTFVDASDQLSAAYEKLADSIREEIVAKPAPDPQQDPRRAQIKRIAKRAEKLRGTAHLSGVLKFSQSLLGTKATAFDQNPAILVARNGVVDLAAGLFREHRHTDMATVQIPCDFNPEATCPRWDRFLDYFMGGDQDMIDYLARAAGYSLTGYVDQDVLFFCYGKGANGKSTFTATMKMLLGDLMTTIPMVALLAKASDNNFDYRKAQMEGKRLVVSDEIPESQTLSESAIKTLVGGDEITARRPYEKPYTFHPTHKLWMVGNHKPNIKGTDLGIWRRVQVIPWLITMPETKRRPRHEILADHREEMPGIFLWAIRGFIDLVDNGGLRPPKSIQHATREYQTDSDQFGRFLEERTEKVHGFSIALTELRETFAAWCEDEGEQPRYTSNKRCANYLREHGFSIVAGHQSQKHVVGIRLTPLESA